MKKLKTRELVLGGLIAASYAGLTYLSAFIGAAYGPFQFRFSEALTVLPALFPPAVGGLTVGCLLANIGSPYGALDVFFGTAATFLAAVLTQKLSKIKIFKLPLLSFLAPILVNAVVVGLELSLFTTDNATLFAFLAAAFDILVSQTAVVGILGIPLYMILKKYNIFMDKK